MTMITDNTDDYDNRYTVMIVAQVAKQKVYMLKHSI